MVNSLTIYLSVYLIISLVALSIQLIASASLVPKTVNLYLTLKPFRVAVQIIAAVLPVILLLYICGDKIIGFLLFVDPEYKHITITAILTFFILQYVKKKNFYKYLEIPGSALLILWLLIFTILTLTHSIFHFHLIDKGTRLFNYLTAVIPGNFKVIPYIILVSWIIIFILLIDIVITKISNMLFDYLEEKARVSFQEKIIELVYDDAYENGMPSGEQTYLKNIQRFSFTLNIFNKELFRLHETIYGSLHERIHRIFDLISVSDRAHKYLYNRLWYYKIKGLHIYAQLGDTSEIKYIRKLTNSRNNVLRSEAQLALARLNENEKPLDYLADYVQTLTEWDQINLIHYFTINQKPVGDLSGLLASANPGVIIFGLQCIRLFKQFDYHDQIIELTKHTNTKVQNTAFLVLSLFEEPEDAVYILNCYNNTLALSPRISMVRALRTIGNSVAIHFLIEQISSETNDEFCIELFRALNRIDPQEALQLAATDNAGLSKLYEHVIDTTL